jgi:hypothetical protein
MSIKFNANMNTWLTLVDEKPTIRQITALNLADELEAAIYGRIAAFNEEEEGRGGVDFFKFGVPEIGAEYEDIHVFTKSWAFAYTDQDAGNINNLIEQAVDWSLSRRAEIGSSICILGPKVDVSILDIGAGFNVSYTFLGPMINKASGPEVEKAKEILSEAMNKKEN